jgi:hypothetical protein
VEILSARQGIHTASGARPEAGFIVIGAYGSRTLLPRSYVARVRSSIIEMCRRGRFRVIVDVVGQSGLEWTKSRKSQSIGMCFEVAEDHRGVLVRNSRTPEDGALVFTRGEFEAFVDGCRHGEFDRFV